MQIASIDIDTGRLVLDAACKFNLTFYDSAYLTEQRNLTNLWSPTTRNLPKQQKTLAQKRSPAWLLKTTDSMDKDIGLGACDASFALKQK